MFIQLKRRDADAVADFFKKNQYLIDRLLTKIEKGETLQPVQANQHEEEEAEETVVMSDETIDEAMGQIEYSEEGDTIEVEMPDTVDQVAEEIEDFEEEILGDGGLLDDDEEDDDEEDQAAEPDDLTEIKGLGAKTVEKLAAHGITTFEDIANLSEERIDEIDEEIRRFRSNYEKKEWRQQAKDLM